jgi:hypothetical protein
LAHSQKEKLIMSVAAVQTPQLVFSHDYQSIPREQIGGVTMYAYFSFNEGIGPDRSHGAVAGHIRLEQGGLEDPNVGNFTVHGTFVAYKTADIEDYVTVHFHSVQGLMGQQTIGGMMLLKGGFKSGQVTYTYTPKGGHPLITVSSEKVGPILLKS